MRLSGVPSRGACRISQPALRQHFACSVTNRNGDFNRNCKDISVEQQSITIFFDALSSKGVVSLSAVLDADVSYEHRPFNVNKDMKPESHHGFNKVLDFYSSAMSRAPTGLAFILDDVQEQDDDSFSVKFHLEMEGIPLPWSTTTGNNSPHFLPS